MFNCQYIGRVLNRIARVNLPLARDIDKRHGFILATDVLDLVAVDPELEVLVRCNNGRFLCSVRRLTGILSVIDKGEHKVYDYVRDVSIPVPMDSRV
jgi:hypothetical protein